VSSKGGAKRPPEPKEVTIARLRHRTYALTIDRLFLLARTVAKGLFLYLIAVEEHHMVVKLAEGKVDWNSLAESVFRGHVATWIAMSTTALAVGVAYNERRLRRKVTAKNDDHIKKLEKKYDPKRSSSNLLSDGSTRKEDQDDR
jgi:hypothetical protein